MIVMVANTSGFTTGWLAGTFPGGIGWLLNSNDWKGCPRPRSEMPWAIDNGAYASYKNGTPWNETNFYCMISQTFECKPRWVAVPDVVADREGTLKLWHVHAPRIQAHTLAFCVQDGMTCRDVPKNAEVIFVGGTTEWKWNTVKGWCSDFPRVHVGKVNTEKRLWQLLEYGAESCDGTGWFRGGDNFRTNPQLNGLYHFLKTSGTVSTTRNGSVHEQPELFLSQKQKGN